MLGRISVQYLALEDKRVFFPLEKKGLSGFVLLS